MQQRLDIVVVDHVGHARMFAMHVGTAQVFLAHFFMGHGFHDVRAGHEHVARPTDHHGEIGQRGAVNGTPGARPHDNGNLRDDARGQHVALEDFGEPGERIDTLLNAGTARIVEADDGRAHFHRHVLHFADFLGVVLGQRAAEHGEILAVDEHEAAVDGALASDDAIARNLVLFHAEIGAAMLHEHVVFLEGIRIEQDFQALARGQLAFFMLGTNAGCPTPDSRRFAAKFEFFNNRHGVHLPTLCCGRSGRFSILAAPPQSGKFRARDNPVLSGQD